MKRSCLAGAVFACIFMCFALPVNAALFSRLGGKLVYDSDLNITWLADGNLAESNTFGVTGINLDGSMSWASGLPQAWIGAMNSTYYLGINNWRLPNTLHPDGSCELVDANRSYGRYCTGSEMGHLYYTEFGLGAGEGIGDGSPVTNIGPFKNVRRNTYWSQTAVQNSGRQYVFQFQAGYQNLGLTNINDYAWPVFDGDIFITLLRCDLNDNGTVDAGDLSQVIRMVVGDIADDLDCDINNGGFGDGTITTSDLIIITRIVVGLIPEIYN
jgi:hypothetical protein